MRDLKEHSLALVKDNKVIFDSTDKGIRPLVECVIKFKGKIRNATLQDRVVGLAAAKLIVYSGMVNQVYTLLISKKAKEYLKKKKISFEFVRETEKIMNDDMTDVCGMEKMASNYKDDEKFFEDVKGKLFPQDED